MNWENPLRKELCDLESATHSLNNSLRRINMIDDADNVHMQSHKLQHAIIKATDKLQSLVSKFENIEDTHRSEGSLAQNESFDYVSRIMNALEPRSMSLMKKWETQETRQTALVNTLWAQCMRIEKNNIGRATKRFLESVDTDRIVRTDAIRIMHTVKPSDMVSYMYNGGNELLMKRAASTRNQKCSPSEACFADTCLALTVKALGDIPTSGPPEVLALLHTT